MENNVDEQYLENLNLILTKGTKKEDRTGISTLSVFDLNMKFDMNKGFPLLTSKKMFTKGIIYELIWLIKGDTNIKYLVDNNINIWTGDAYKNYNKNNSDLSIEEFINKIKSDDMFAKEHGELGLIYGSQWRKFGESKMVIPPPNGFNLLIHKGIDQLQNLINDLQSNPDSRRLIVNSWNATDLIKMILPPCHYVFQCYTRELSIDERKSIWLTSINKSIYYADDLNISVLNDANIPKRALSLKFTMRSCDFPLGVPYNIASYGLLLCLLAKEVNMTTETLSFSGGDCHIYLNQIEGVKKQLSNNTFKLSTIKLTNNSIFDFKYENIEIINYQSDKIIKYPLSN